MIQNKKTLELVLPQWQGGNDPNYIIGNEILSTLVPKSSRNKRLRVPVSTTTTTPDRSGVVGKSILLKQFEATTNILEIEQPDRVITLGGDCSSSESPFDYLNGKYSNMGVIWLDVHPDLSNQKNSHHVHEMVLANLLNIGDPSFNKQVQHHIKPQNVMLAGLDYDALRPMDKAVNEVHLAYSTPKELSHGNDTLLSWINRNHIQHLAVHWDLDVLSPTDFRSIYPAEPHSDVSQFPSAVGSMTLDQVVKLLKEVEANTDLVGLTIAEHMPWDAINLRKGLNQLSIFK